ncbi:hypothetical protein M2459_002232 [Parabacteroides sp. PF5-5]|uniref:hypothetical protein n=1 Tax=unclassified Parabacteroides TaxID=2649774 RepID=UPI002476D50B|nr:MULTISPECIES: hypothetical protein [unclassified Parabacteroides]MDH6305135.1 hypothetical protein [Parabacteroides sp. PH5-39]MDH6316485.1 hypothetical protein [Parabacteroides sp. PF5-13]MDH6319995.1 hypothetical protein [Parabacteroides sp. PH5-13]MDH6323772.1 hypothetical protein [Parabacteroides sp. PH5-8]MDH6327672.1 hypothetical protein [Parabacteroides sp. PH5-41]
MKRHLILLFCILVSWQINAQDIKSYINTASVQSIIYTGKEEPKYPTYILNHPYWKTSEYQEGSLSFDGQFYPNVMLRLNQHLEELVICSPDKRFNILLPANRIDYALIGSNYIFYLPKDKEMLPKGYYIRLHDGEHKVVRRETFFLNSATKDMAVEFSFIGKTRFYIYKDGVYHQVNNKSSVLKLFKSKKKELNQYIKQQKLNFRKSPEEAIVAVAQQYQILTR